MQVSVHQPHRDHDDCNVLFSGSDVMVELSVDVVSGIVEEWRVIVPS